MTDTDMDKTDACLVIVPYLFPVKP